MYKVPNLSRTKSSLSIDSICSISAHIRLACPVTVLGMHNSLEFHSIFQQPIAKAIWNKPKGATYCVSYFYV